MFFKIPLSEAFSLRVSWKSVGSCSVIATCWLKRPELVHGLLSFPFPASSWRCRDEAFLSLTQNKGEQKPSPCPPRTYSKSKKESFPQSPVKARGLACRILSDASTSQARVGKTLDCFLLRWNPIKWLVVGQNQSKGSMHIFICLKP